MDDGSGQCRQCAGGTIVDDQCQCDARYLPSTDPNAYSLCEGCNGVIYENQCIAQCPQGTLYNSGYCVAECPEGRVQGEGDAVGACLPVECPEGTLHEFDRCVEECGTGYNFVHEGQCLSNCPSGLIELDGQCLAQCPEASSR
ncbi:hypothetical protein [Methyloceanibacter superfactus]|uniref:hypothetical protein n=1 Tax=Methyloceanibacter superfactus TaxID=1774969 RepID=UPI00114C9806|nr:hypothetical protein [Methyloceanibacter superfactus]